MKIRIPDDALNQIVVATLADGVRTIESLKMRKLDERDFKKLKKAMKRIIVYYGGNLDELNLEGCMHTYECDCGFK